jgi:hypothetical protein
VTVIGLLISLVAHLQVDLKQGIKYFYASAAVWGFSILVRVLITLISLVGIGRFRGEATIKELPGGVTRVDIQTTGRHAWQAGQHVYLRLTKLNPFVSHTYSRVMLLMTAIAPIHHRLYRKPRPYASYVVASYQDSGRDYSKVGETSWNQWKYRSGSRGPLWERGGAAFGLRRRSPYCWRRRWYLRLADRGAAYPYGKAIPDGLVGQVIRYILVQLHCADSSRSIHMVRRQRGRYDECTGAHHRLWVRS